MIASRGLRDDQFRMNEACFVLGLVVDELQPLLVALCHGIGRKDVAPVIQEKAGIARIGLVQQEVEG